MNRSGFCSPATTEADARVLLHSWPGDGGLEDRRPALEGGASGWIVAGELEGWHFRVAVVAGGLQISATGDGAGAPAVWVVPG